jgi:hypothetical protein
MDTGNHQNRNNMHTKSSYTNLAKGIRIKLKTVVLVLLLSSISVAAFADDPGLPGGNDPDVPIDGGLSLLIAAGVGYGAKKLRTKKDTQKTVA